MQDRQETREGDEAGWQGDVDPPRRSCPAQRRRAEGDSPVASRGQVRSNAPPTATFWNHRRNLHAYNMRFDAVVVAG